MRTYFQPTFPISLLLFSVFHILQFSANFFREKIQSQIPHLDQVWDLTNETNLQRGIHATSNIYLDLRTYDFCISQVLGMKFQKCRQ